MNSPPHLRDIFDRLTRGYTLKPPDRIYTPIDSGSICPNNNP